jgi:hypothetical protein
MHNSSNPRLKAKSGSVQQMLILALAAILALAGMAIFIEPQLLLERTAQLAGDVAGRLWLGRAYGAGFIALAACLVLENRDVKSTPIALVLFTLLCAPLLLFTFQFSEWWIDDAGITFSYSRSLAEGAGVTFQPGEPPTEGYSSTLWMLILALAGWLGFDIPATAKALGIAFSIVSLLLALRVIRARTESVLALAFTAAAISTAPFVVWAASGQEHGLQAFLLVLIVHTATFSGSWRPLVAGLLGLLVLTRPEAPLIVIGVFAVALVRSFQKFGRLRLRDDLIVAALPFAVFVALMAWRLWYFGDPFPNPYYAKAAGSSFTVLLNPLGAGWDYSLRGLRESGLILLTPLALFAAWGTKSRTLHVLGAALAAHMAFVIWAGGDWMGQYRFLMPVIPLLVIPAIVGAAQAFAGAPRALLSVSAAIFFATTSVTELDRFLDRPTTPLSVVSEVGHEFAKVADLLGIKDPLLAHHDAGAISYERMVRLVDLGGLVNREIAKNMRDRAFLENYIFNERRPDFIFGALNFAAASGFTESSDFEKYYIPIVFENRPVMKSHFSHILRQRVRERPGVKVKYESDGSITGIIILSSGTS